MFLLGFAMEHYLANFDFEKNKNKTAGNNYLVIYTLTEAGPFGPVYVRSPEYRFRSKYSFELDKAKSLLAKYEKEFDFPCEINLFFDSDFGKYRIHVVGEEALSKYMKTHYKFKFYPQSQTELLRALFQGQGKKIDVSSDLEKCMVGQKHLNDLIRSFWDNYVMPLRSSEREHILTHRDAVLWLNLDERNAENLLAKIIRNKKWTKEVFELYQEHQEEGLSDEILQQKVTAIIGKKKAETIYDRIYRFFHIPAGLLLGDAELDKGLQQIRDANNSLDSDLKKLDGDNRSVLDLENMCVKIFIERGLHI
jgi:hypothetical protein